jgi:hypothetical protein
MTWRVTIIGLRQNTTQAMSCNFDGHPRPMWAGRDARQATRFEVSSCGCCEVRDTRRGGRGLKRWIYWRL